MNTPSITDERFILAGLKDGQWLEIDSTCVEDDESPEDAIGFLRSQERGCFAGAYTQTKVVSESEFEALVKAASATGNAPTYEQLKANGTLAVRDVATGKDFMISAVRFGLDTAWGVAGYEIGTLRPSCSTHLMLSDEVVLDWLSKLEFLPEGSTN